MAETVITSDTTDDVCSLTVEEIDSIVDERTAALISGNTDKALELTEYLHENGMIIKIIITGIEGKTVKTV